MKLERIEIAAAKVLTEAIFELKDPRIPLIVTVNKVKMTSDLQIARVYVSTLGEIDPLLEALERAKGRLQHHLAKRLELRRTPSLSFFKSQ